MPLPLTLTPDKREAILEAALRLFAARGFHGTAVPMIAQQARVGAGTVYRYFESKDQLVNALYQREKIALTEHLIASIPEDAAPRTQFRRCWRALWAYTRRNPEAAQFLELHHHSSYLDAKSLAVEAASLEPLLGLVERGQALREIRPGPAVLIVAVAFGCFLGLLRVETLGQAQLDEEALDECERRAWAAIRE